MNFNFARSFEPAAVINQKLAEAQAGLGAAKAGGGGKIPPKAP
jgi:hypothetical protein